MKAIQLECPSCGAPLSVDVDGDREFVFCTYCGHQIHLDHGTRGFRFTNAHEAGRDFERGRQSAWQGQNQDLAKKLRRAIDKATQIDSCEKRIIAVADTLRKEQSSVNDRRLWALCIPAVLFAFINPILGGLVLVGIIFFLVRVQKNRREKKNEAIMKLQQELSMLYYEKEQTERIETGLALNEKYMDLDVLTQLYELVLSERAYTLSQAINLYEDICYKRRMEQIAREQLENQKRQTDFMEQQKRQAEEEAEENESNGLNLGKALLFGGLAIAAMKFLGKRD